MRKIVKANLVTLALMAIFWSMVCATPAVIAAVSSPEGDPTTQLLDIKCVTITITSPPPGGVYKSLPTLTIHFLDLTRGIDRGFYQIDGCSGSWTDLWSYNSSSSDTTTSWTVPSVSPGAHTLRFKALDDAGVANPDTCTNIWNFIYDPILPTAEVVSPPSGGIHKDLPALMLRFRDNLSLNRAFYQIDNCTGMWNEFWPYNSNATDTSFSWAVLGVSEGQHAIYFKVLDDADNWNMDTCSFSWTFTYDHTPPTFSVTSPPSGEFYGSLPTLSVDIHDNIGVDRAFYQIDGCTGPWTELWSYNSSRMDTSIIWPIPDLALGVHRVYFKIIDDGGISNSDTCSNYWEFTLGSTVSMLPSAQLGRCAGLDTCWIAADDKAVNIKAAFFRLDYDGYYVTPISVIKGPGLTPPEDYVLYQNIFPDSLLISLAVLNGHFDGPNTLVGVLFRFEREVASTAISIDSAILRDLSNNDIPARGQSITLQTDCTLPTMSVTEPASGGFYGYLPTLTVAFHDNIGLDRGYYQIDNCSGSWLPLWSYNSNSLDTTINWAVPGIPQGSHTIYFKIADDAGNPNSDTCSYTWSFTYGVPGVSLSPSAQLDKCGNVDTLYIDVDDKVRDVKAAFFRIGFDHNFVNPTQVILKDLTPPSDFIVYPYIYTDSILINLAALTGHFDGPQRILGIILTTDNEVTSTPIRIDSCILRDLDNQNISSNVLHASIQVECTPPDINIESPPSGESYDVLPNLTIHCLDNVGLSRGYYQVDACTGPWIPLWTYESGSSDTAFNWTVPPISVGVHKIYLKAIDDAGNINPDSCTNEWVMHYYGGCDCVPGDADASGILNLLDITRMINSLYKDGPPPIPYAICSGDLDASCRMNVLDITYLINFLYKSGPAPTDCRNWVNACGGPLRLKGE